MAVCLNAAHTAFALRQQVEAAGIWDIEVFFGAYDVLTYQVCMPIHTDEDLDALDPNLVNLAAAPSHPREFATLATGLAQRLHRPDHGESVGPPPGKAEGSGPPDQVQ